MQRTFLASLASQLDSAHVWHILAVTHVHVLVPSWILLYPWLQWRYYGNSRNRQSEEESLLSANTEQ